MEILRADSIRVRFGNRTVLSSATLRAEAGKVTALLGRNGEGKSSLLKVATGLLEPDSGCVHFNGAARLKVTLPQLAREGLFFLADRDLLLPVQPLRRQLGWIARQYQRPFIDEAADLVGITGRLDQVPVRCSGGERRRAEVAAAWLRGPVCLLADEPYRGIAPVDAEVLSSVFRRMASEGCAVVVTGHEVHTMLDVADNVVWCTDGTTYELGTAEMARANERFRRGYLGIP